MEEGKRRDRTGEGRKRGRRKVLAGILSLLMLALLAAGCDNKEEIDDAGLLTTSEGHFTWENATVYFAMTDRFYDGDASNNNSYGRQTVDAKGTKIGTFNGGDIRGMTEKLKEGYFRELGVDAIWITAPYEQIHGYIAGGPDGDFAHYGFHGYYALDYTMMDRNVGTVEEFREFTETAHSQGIRIVMDVVMNHVGYSTLKDMETYGFGKVTGIDSGWTPDDDEDFRAFHEFVDYTDEAAWAKWWSPEWVRAGVAGYLPGGNDDITLTLAGLPDIRTELTGDAEVPPVLAKKWAMEADGSYDPWIVPAARDLRQDMEGAPADFMMGWITAWVEEFGIDGFRVDTAKHVELERWTQLEKEATEALRTYRRENPGKPGADWTEDFWMNGEVWGHGVAKDRYFEAGFDSLINFTFQGERRDGPAFNPDTMDRIFTNYAKALNGDPTFNVLSYISQHDTHLYDRNKLVTGGTYLLLLPGAVKIFYGDETARPMGDGGSDFTQGTRSPMNWDSIDEDILTHFRKLGSFRNRNVAVGAGAHRKLMDEPYTFTRSYEEDGLSNRVVVVLDAAGETETDVSGIFSDGDIVRDAYSGDVKKVEGGKVSFTPDQNGIILMEKLGER
jgi:alpha-amylase